MKVLVIYKCRSGYTRKYANWISEELQSDILEVSKINKQILTNYDIIVYGGCLFSNQILGINKMMKYYDHLKSKKVIVFAVGIIPILKNTTTKILSTNFTKDQKKHINFCYLSGGFNYRQLSLFDKIKMFFFKKKNYLQKEKENGSIGGRNINFIFS